MPKKRSSTARLLYASTEESADMRYLARVSVPDAFPVIIHQGVSTGLLNMLEYNRVARDSALDQVLPLETWAEGARKAIKDKAEGMPRTLLHYANTQGIKAFEVPSNFPLGLARQLETLGLTITPCEGTFFPERVRKTREDADAIRLANQASAAGLRAAEKTLRAALVSRNGTLKWKGKTLTSERLRSLVEIACLENGAVAARTICAGGDQACDPHEEGHGPLRANELIIIDVFPRRSLCGHYGDMTRTFLKGSANDAQHKLVRTVDEARRQALSILKPGISGKTVHQSVVRHFKKAGYQTSQIDGVWQGFIHGTGHGLGLEVHEEPRVNRLGTRLPAGAVVTIEPGLYYRGLGGCRIEDVAYLHSQSCEILSDYPYRWQIR